MSQSIKKKAVEVQIHDNNTDETRLIYVRYDQKNISTFEGRICTTCNARTSDLDLNKNLSHELNCRVVEIIVTIGDNISVESPSCFSDIKVEDLRRIYDSAKKELTEVVVINL
jgi:hypothetical protein